MHLKSLYLRNFRNYAEAEIHFSPKLNVLHGENAQGKTNLLEAIYLVATGRSFRAQQLQELIREGQPFFFIEAILLKEEIEHKLQISFDGETKKLVLDGNAYGTLQHLLGLLPSVLYTPSDAELADGSPMARRRFLNLHLAQRDPLYIHHLSRFWRAMKQRNTLLRQKKGDGIECWEVEMASSAAYLLQTRQALITELKAPLEQISQRLSSTRETHEIRFQPSYPLEGYLAQLQRNRGREQHLGLTLTGPHRDDFSLLINSKQTRGFASEGQKKTAVASLRLSEWELLTKTAEVPAVLGIDDLGLHLDEMRSALLTTALASLGQVFVTAPHLPSGLSDAKRFRVTSGKVLDE
ncbi:MAG: DNA replication/repair protein RecF [Verrucomicrobiota bacterium]|nr:DNA replication/repair protein RecF [Verrucomicrobiota bacterium]